MKKERTLSYAMSQKLTEKDLQSVSAADGTIRGTSEVTYKSGSGWDTAIDVAND
jgi:hypothetical protein